MRSLKSALLLSSCILILSACHHNEAKTTNTTLTKENKEATKFTVAANEEIVKDLDFTDMQAYEDADRGFIATWPEDTIKDENGKVVWDFKTWKFLDKHDHDHGHFSAPDTANPSLWRQSQIVAKHGLYKVVDGLYQVRGFDLSNVTFMRGEKGWIVIDTGYAKETAIAAYKLIREHVEDLPITAMIITHSHIDHFGGMEGLITQEDIDSGKVPVYAPEGFFEHSISENLNAGNAMSRRASYMYGNIVPNGEKGNIGAGLGQTVSTGEPTILVPSVTIENDGEKKIIDGVEFQFILAMGTEAPSEMMFYTPKYKAFTAAEDCTHTLHNISTLRGAMPREADKWSAALNNAINMWGDEWEVMYAPHHWPIWGNERIDEMMTSVRDTYKYINDQTLRLANMGYTPKEIAEVVVLPKDLNNKFYNRGYYGSLSHNLKATYDRYFSAWWDGNPSNLNPLPPVAESKKYVEYMGGADKIIESAKKDYANGEYRWVVSVMNNVIFADPTNQEARNLSADAMEQLGYQSESGPWRNYYLTGAMELRDGVRELPTPVTASRSITEAIPSMDFFEFLAIHVVPSKAEGLDIKVNIEFKDNDEMYYLTLENSVMNVNKGALDKPDSTIKISRETLNQIILKETSFAKEVQAGNVTVENLDDVEKMFGTLANPKFWFNIVTPNGLENVRDDYKFE